MKSLSAFRPIAILFILGAFALSSVFAAKKPLDPASVRARIAARGVGLGVRVSLNDGTKAKGTIAAIGENGFDLWPSDSSHARHIDYAQVTSVHRDPVMGRKTTIVLFGALLVTGVVVAAECGGGGGPPIL